MRPEIHQKIFYGGLILAAVTLPYSLLANSVSIILLLTNWLWEGNLSVKIQEIKKNSLLHIFFIFYALHITALLFTANTDNGFFELQKKLSLFVLPLVLATSNKLSSIQINNILKLFLSSILLTTFICLGYALYRTNILETYSNPNWLFFSYVDLTKIINLQPTYFALYVCMAILILLYLLSENNRSYNNFKKSLLFICIAYLVIFLFLLSSRMEILALVTVTFFGIIFYYYKIGKIFKGLAFIGIITIALMTIAYQLPFMRERVFDTLGVKQETIWINQYGDGKNAAPEMRKQKWKSSINVIKENWLLGVGTGDVQDELQKQYKNIGFEVGYTSRYNAHNQYLETWIGLGILGLLSLLSCLAIPLVLSFRNKNYLYAAFLLLFFLCCITESMLCRQHGIVFYSLFTSLFAFHSTENKKVV